MKDNHICKLIYEYWSHYLDVVIADLNVYELLNFIRLYMLDASFFYTQMLAK